MRFMWGLLFFISAVLFLSALIGGKFVNDEKLFYQLGGAMLVSGTIASFLDTMNDISESLAKLANK